MLQIFVCSKIVWNFVFGDEKCWQAEKCIATVGLALTTYNLLFCSVHRIPMGQAVVGCELQRKGIYPKSGTKTCSSWGRDAKRGLFWWLGTYTGFMFRYGIPFMEYAWGSFSIIEIIWYYTVFLFFNASHSNIAFISETFSGHCTWCSFCTLITLDKWKFASQLNIFQIILFSLE